MRSDNKQVVDTILAATKIRGRAQTFIKKCYLAPHPRVHGTQIGGGEGPTTRRDTIIVLSHNVPYRTSKNPSRCPVMYNISETRNLVNWDRAEKLRR
ncbi:hypothetical protein J6590_009687 [Homalodisca vitripennis]|nr:hypothetical protein J6590_009687 [Homalodisca vitripennis]